MQTKRLAVLVLVAAMGAGCVNATQKALSITLATLNASRDGFLEYDGVHQQNLVAASTDLADGKLKLEAYRRAREPIIRALFVAYAALAAATADQTSGKLDEAGKAVQIVFEMVRDLNKMDAAASAPASAPAVTAVPPASQPVPVVPAVVTPPASVPVVVPVAVPATKPVVPAIPAKPAKPTTKHGK